jgi:hypothetical protein
MTPRPSPMRLKQLRENCCGCDCDECGPIMELFAELDALTTLIKDLKVRNESLRDYATKAENKLAEILWGTQGETYGHDSRGK